MEEIMNVLKSIQEELDNQKIAIRKSGEDVAKHVTENINKILEERLFKWEKNQEILKEKIENQEKRIYFLEKQARVRNLVFFGIEEKEKSYDDLQTNITNFINERFNTSLEARDIQEIRRIGKQGDRPRPIIITFATLGQKINILKQKRVLKDTQFYLKEDFPKQVLEKRKELQEQAKLEKEKGNIVRIKYDKLVIQNPNNKRSLPVSPVNTSKSQSDISTQAKKKNKTLKTHATIQRSNSVSEGIVKPSMLQFLVNKNTSSTAQGQNNENRDSKA
ncbi:uncharacterized protein LOC142986126 [Anticarsia gemmatalis]|uniref:uncharacterized protein LOC142986126 n=1 Tax=Anticarsia gemmatalis TaxID=129554 RepID=UPI003F765D96